MRCAYPVEKIRGLGDKGNPRQATRVDWDKAAEQSHYRRRMPQACPAAGQRRFRVRGLDNMGTTKTRRPYIPESFCGGGDCEAKNTDLQFKGDEKQERVKKWLR